MSQEKDRSYIAFISYRHRPLDKQAAERIQKRIENYRVPKEFREKVGGDRLGMVFRDEDELPASSSLSDSITYALDHSKYLLVICTPDLPESKWCEQEIRYFLKTHDRDHILAVLADGTPDVSFSPLLLHTFDEDGNITGDTEPLAANIAGENHSINKKAFHKEIVRIYAALIGCPFDALWQRERRARTNRLLTLSGIIMAAMAVFIGVVLSKNAQIAEQNDSLQRQMSAIKVDTGRTQLESYDVKGALQSGLDALLDDPSGSLYDHRAEKLLADAAYAYQGPDWHSSLLYSQSTAIETLALTPDGSTAVFSDEVLTVRAVSTADGSLLWEYAAETARDNADPSPAEVFAFQDLIICKYADRIIARRPADGSEVWRYTYQGIGGNHFRAFNSDGSRMMLLDQADAEDETVFLIVLDTGSGTVTGRRSVSSEVDTVSLSCMNPWYFYAGSFSDDGRYGALAVYVTHRKADGTDAGENGTLKLALYDLENFTEVYSVYADESSGLSTINYGVAVINEKDLLCARFTGSYGGITLSLVDGETKSGTQTLTNQSISTKTGTAIDLFGEYMQVIPMKIHDNLALIASENDLFVYTLGTEMVLAKELSVPGNIRSLVLADEKTDEVYAWNADGAASYYDLEQDGTMGSWGATDYDQKDIAHLCPFYNTENNLQFCISVMNSHPGNLLIMKNTSDPSGEVISEPSWKDLLTNCQVASSPSEDIVYIKYKENDTEQFSVAAFDAADHKKLSSTSFDLDFFDNTIFGMDQESFLLGKYLFRLDGTREYYLENINEASESDFMDGYFRHIALSDGTVMTVYDCCAAKSTTLVPVWLDGKLVSASCDLPAGISFEDGKIMETGGNGLVVGYGIHRYKQEDGTLITAEKDGFMIFDAIHEKRFIFDDRHPEARERMLAVGNAAPVFACADELGHISLYNTETNTSEDLDTAYAISEIRALTFSPDDRYLLVITRSGKLECFDLAANTRVFSEQPDIFSSFRYTYVDQLTCTASKDGRYLYLKASKSNDPYGLWLSLDQTSWTVAASSDLVYESLPADDHLYAWRSEAVYRYPLHSLEDLTAQAKERLE